MRHEVVSDQAIYTGKDNNMKIGLQIPNFTWPGSPANLGSKLAEIARTADDAGFASPSVN